MSGDLEPTLGPGPIRIIGPGRAGRSLNAALGQVGHITELAGRDDDPSGALDGADIVVIAVPDDSIADVAQSIEPGEGLVVHLSGSRTLDVLAPHARRASMHPLMSLPNERVGAARLLEQCHFAVCGTTDADTNIARSLVSLLGGIAFDVADEKRASYHAAACIAANHVVAICAQVERLAIDADVPVSAFWAMVETTVANVTDMGASAALTGPAARGDWGTIATHLGAIGEGEQALYRAVAKAAAELAGNDWPDGFL